MLCHVEVHLLAWHNHLLLPLHLVYKFFAFALTLPWILCFSFLHFLPSCRPFIFLLTMTPHCHSTQGYFTAHISKRKSDTWKFNIHSLKLSPQIVHPLIWSVLIHMTLINTCWEIKKSFPYYESAEICSNYTAVISRDQTIRIKDSVGGLNLDIRHIGVIALWINWLFFGCRILP